jgi:hypothetical protein
MDGVMAEFIAGFIENRRSSLGLMNQAGMA